MICKSWEQRTLHELIDPKAIELIEGADLLLNRFGDWPTFEDAEVLSLSFDRGNHWWVLETGEWSRRVPPSLIATFYVFDSRYAEHAPERKPTKVSIQFYEFREVEIDGFNYQNPIVGLGIKLTYSADLKKTLFSIDWGGTAIPHEVSFSCERIHVLSAEPMVWLTPYLAK